MKPKARGPVEGLTPTQRDSLAVFEGLLMERALPLGLVSARDRDRLWDRHILDSLRGLAGFANADLVQGHDRVAQAPRSF